MFMSEINYYEILEVSPQATQGDIKQAYRRLAKQFHPDHQREEMKSQDQIILINAAYEVLKDPQHRRLYDQQLSYGYSPAFSARRQERTTEAQHYYHRTRKTEREEEVCLREWLKEVYQPVNHLISTILEPLEDQIDTLSADPFDDELMEGFQGYIERCRESLSQAQTAFRAYPNPANLAGVAANLYYCLNHIGDGLEDLGWFTLNYDEHYLHTGKEMFRIANTLRDEAQYSVNSKQ